MISDRPPASGSPSLSLLLGVRPKFREMIGIGLALSETTYCGDRTRLAGACAVLGDVR
jgi:hypothetical protein